MTPCERLNYSEGDWFEVIDDHAHDYRTKGMILKLCHDDGTYSPGFEYVSGNKTNLTDSVEVIYVGLQHVKKIQKFKVPEIAKDSQATYSVQDIESAFEHLGWLSNSKDKLLEALKVVTDSEYKEYLRLKLKYETE